MPDPAVSHQRPITCSGAFAVVATDLLDDETLAAYRRRVEAVRAVEAPPRAGRGARVRAYARVRRSQVPALSS